MEMYIVLAILAGALILFASEIFSIDVVALLILLSLIGFGVLMPEEAVAGFANPAVITIAAMFVLSAGLLRTGEDRQNDVHLHDATPGRGGGSTGRSL